MRFMTVFLTGGAGYIGSHTAVALIEAGYNVAAADSLCNSSAKSLLRAGALTGRSIPLSVLDLRDTDALADALAKSGAGAVVHFAGLKSVPESVADPTGYYANNLGCTLSLLQAMRRVGIRKLIFSSSATVYRVDRPELRETDPLGCTNPYGRSKLMSERFLRDAADTGQIDAVALRYFNPVGAHPSGKMGEDPRGVPANLAPCITQVLSGRLPYLRVTGTDFPTPDGTGVRDYIHVMDLAEGHAAALRWCLSNTGFAAVNLGTGHGSSVLEVVAAFEQASGLHVARENAPRRPGDLPAYWANTDLARELFGWQARRSLADMCRDAWNWQKNNPDGYAEDRA